MWDQKEPGSNYWPGMCTARKNALPMEQGTKNFNGLLHSSEGKKKKITFSLWKRSWKRSVSTPQKLSNFLLRI
jgi:hypothetical protein